MNTEHKSDEELKHYLLGEMSLSDREELEKRYLVDGVLHERLLAMEDELLDLHLKGHLSAIQSEYLMRNLRGAANGFERLAFAHALAQIRSQERRKHDHRRSVLWRMIIPIPVAAAIIVTAVLWRNTAHPGITRQPSPAATASPTSALGSPETGSAKGAQSAPKPTAAQNDDSNAFKLEDQTRSARNHSILELHFEAYRGGSDRGAKTPGKLSIGHQSNVRLSADVNARFERYLAFLQRAQDEENGDNRNHESILKPNKILYSRREGKVRVIAEFDAGRLASGEYILVIQGQHPGDAIQTLAEYPFGLSNPYTPQPR